MPEDLMLMTPEPHFQMTCMCATQHKRPNNWKRVNSSVTHIVRFASSHHEVNHLRTHLVQVTWCLRIFNKEAAMPEY